MRTFITLVVALVLLLIIPTRAHATWSVVQHPINAACSASASSCAVTLTQSTGTGKLLIISMSAFSATIRTIASISAGGSFVHCSNCSAQDAGSDIVDMGYVLSDSVTAGPITVTLSGAVGAATWAVAIYEYSTTLAPANFDVSGSGTDASSTSVLGKALTLTGANDVIMQAISPATGVVSAITSPYTNPDDHATFNAGAIQQTVGTAPTWTTTKGTASVAAEAFKESSVLEDDIFSNQLKCTQLQNYIVTIFGLIFGVFMANEKIRRANVPNLDPAIPDVYCVSGARLMDGNDHSTSRQSLACSLLSSTARALGDKTRERSI